jgi:F-type H+-transporting ATPase subunit delta
LKLNFYLPHEVAHDEEEVRERCETRWDGDRPMGLRPTSGRRGFDPTRRRRARTRDEARVGRGARGTIARWWDGGARRAMTRDLGAMTDGTTSVARAQVDMVLVPATTGDFGILPGHVPTVSQLRPGVVSVHLNDKDVKKYFVSSGFAFVHADSTADICAIEAVPVEQLDGDAVRKGLAEHQAKFTNAKDDFEKANAQIGIDVCNAMVAALDAK